MRSASTAQFRIIAWLLGAVLSASGSAQPDNDDFARRLPISGRAPVFTAYLLDAGLEPGEPTHGTSTLTAKKSIWWTWTAPFSGYLTLVATSQNTSVGGMAFYTGETVAALTRVAELAPGLLAVSEGTAYQVAMWSASEVSMPEWGAYEGYVCVSWVRESFVGGYAFPDNPFYVDGNTRGTGREPGGEPVHGGEGSGPSVWWNWQPPVNGWAFAVGRGYNFPFSVGVYEGDDYPQLVPLGRSCGPDRWFWPVQSNAVCRVAVAGNGPEVAGTYQLHLAAADLQLASPKDGAHLRLGEQIPITFAGEPPLGAITAYAITSTGEVRTWAAATGQNLVVTNLPRGEYDLLVTVGQGDFEYPAAPVHVWVDGPGDAFAEAIPLASYHNEVSGDLAGTTLEPGEPLVLGDRPGSLWWKWTAPVTGPVFVKLDPRALTEVFRGSNLTALVPVALRISQAVPGAWEFLAAQGEDFHLRVAEGTTSTRDVVLVLDAVEAAPNDDPSRAITLSGPTVEVSGNNVAIQGGTNLVCRSLWYSLVATEQSIWRITPTLQSSATPTFDTKLRIYRGAPLTGSLIEDRPYFWPANVQIEPGTQYFVEVVNPGALPGEGFILRGELLPRPPNDTWENRTRVSGPSATLDGTLAGALPDIQRRTPGVWWTWRAPESGIATIVLPGAASGQWVEVPNAGSVFARPCFDSYEAARVPWNLCFSVQGGVDYDIGVFAPNPDYATTVEARLAFTTMTTRVSYSDGQIFIGLQGYRPEYDGEPAWGYIYRIEPFGGCGDPSGYFVGMMADPLTDLVGLTSEVSFNLYGVVANSRGEVRVTPLNQAYGSGKKNDGIENALPLQGWSARVTDCTDGSSFGTEDAVRRLPQNPDYGSLWYYWVAPSDGEVTVSGGGAYHSFFFFTSPTTTRYRQIEQVGSRFTVVANRKYMIAVVGRNRELVSGDWGNCFGVSLTFTEANPPQLGLTLEEPQADVRYHVNTPVPLAAQLAAVPSGFQAVEFAVSSPNTIDSLSGSETPFTNSWLPQYPGYYNVTASIRLTNGMAYALATRTIAVYSENDDFADRIPTQGMQPTLFVTPYFATLEAGEPLLESAGGAGSVWWRWRAPQSGHTTVLARTPYEFSWVTIALGVYEGEALANLTRVSSSPDRKIHFDAVAGREYSIQAQIVGSYGTVTLTLAQLPNDRFANRLQLEGEHVQTTGDNLHCTREYLEPRHAGRDGGRSLWYAWRAPAQGKVTLDLSGTIVTNLLAVYTGSSVDQLTPVAANAATGVNQVVFPVQAGQDYAIAIDGEFGATGDFILQLNLAPLPPATLSLVSRSDLGTTLRVTGTQGSTVTLIYSDDLSAWATLETRPASANESLEFVDHTASPNGQRFYRAELQAAP